LKNKLIRFRRIFAGGQGGGNRRVLSATQGDADTVIRQKDKEGGQLIFEQFLNEHFAEGA
jgi:hypothetical protein